MKKTLNAILFFCCIGMYAFAQNKSIVVRLTPSEEAQKVQLYVLPLNSTPGESVEMTKADNIYKVEIPSSTSGFYQMIAVRNNGQQMFPLYLPGKAVANLNLHFGEGAPRLQKASRENMALNEFYAYVYENSRKMWTVPFAKADDIYPFLQSYSKKADEILKKYRLAKPVARYIPLWAYVHTSDAYGSVPMATNYGYDQLTFKREDLLAEPEKMLNTDEAMFFGSAPLLVYTSLPYKNDLNKCLSYLEDHYTQPQLVATVKRIVMEQYMSKFDFEKNYDKGMAAIVKAEKEHQIDPKYAKEFAKRRATIPGQPFPEDVVLKNAKGEVVDFASFRGKYVYVDLWASWCGPCCKEVPELQKLEKTLKNKNVVFVSISIDSNENAWKKKMEALNMHGHQLTDAKNKIGASLNVSGIPFFVIYDPEGNLYMYDAPRPSQGQGLVDLLERLK